MLQLDSVTVMLLTIIVNHPVSILNTKQLINWPCDKLHPESRRFTNKPTHSHSICDWWTHRLDDSWTSQLANSKF